MSIRGSVWLKKSKLRPLRNCPLRKSLIPGDVNAAEATTLGDWWWPPSTIVEPQFPTSLVRCHVRLYGTQAQIAAAVALILAEYPESNRIWAQEDGTDRPLGGIDYGRYMDVRTKMTSDGTSTKDALVALIPTLQAAGVTGKVMHHVCSHDDTVVVECVPTEWTI